MFGERVIVLVFGIVVGVFAAQNITSDSEKLGKMDSNSERNVTRVTLMPTVDTQTTPPMKMAATETTTESEHTTKQPGRHRAHNFKDYEMHWDSADGAYDDWDYIDSLTRSSPVLAKLLEDEEIRHYVQDYVKTSPPTPTSHPHRSPGQARGRKGHPQPPPHPRPHPHPYRGRKMLFEVPPSWEDFCKEASTEDEEPFSITDGSFHPRYEEVPGVGVYRLHARPRSWDEARKVCEREGAQLAVPNSREEALALAEIHNRCPHILPTHFNDYQYLGAHDVFFEGRWETIIGDPLNETGYMPWARNQPDNAHHYGENCLTMNRNTFYNDVPCWTELPFICEHA